PQLSVLLPLMETVSDEASAGTSMDSYFHFFVSMSALSQSSRTSAPDLITRIAPLSYLISYLSKCAGSLRLVAVGLGMKKVWVLSLRSVVEPLARSASVYTLL